MIRKIVQQLRQAEADDPGVEAHADAAERLARIRRISLAPIGTPIATLGTIQGTSSMLDEVKSPR